MATAAGSPACCTTFGYYAPAFATGIGFNILNLMVVGMLVAQR